MLAGQDRRLSADPPGQNDLRDWTLSRIVWVANRGFTSADNRRYLRSGDQHYILGEKLRSGSAEAQAAWSRQDAAGNDEKIENRARPRADAAIVRCSPLPMPSVLHRAAVPAAPRMTNPERSARSPSVWVSALMLLPGLLEINRIGQGPRRLVSRPRGRCWRGLGGRVLVRDSGWRSCRRWLSAVR